jgi:putative ABC transport system permease protein
VLVEQVVAVGDLSARPTVVIGGPQPVTATVVGVVREGYEQPLVYRVGRSAGDPAGTSGGASGGPMSYGPPTLELWVRPEQSDAVMATVRNDLALSLSGAQVDAYRTDDQGIGDAIGTLRTAIRGAGVVALVLGGLGVLNVGLVTVRQRIREIGVRRSFGASSVRIFSAVMLESVRATALAGVAAVAAAVLLVRNLPLVEWLADGVPLADDPGFSLEAAVEGMVAATAVGAVAGLLPAVIAVRAEVIDAIRF